MTARSFRHAKHANANTAQLFTIGSGSRCSSRSAPAGNPSVSSRVSLLGQTRGRPTLSRSTVEQLRDDIDHGRTGDKVDAPDPAVVPLGADEEAAGTPLDPDAVEAARTLELSRSCRSSTSLGGGAAWLVTAFCLALGAGLVTWMLWLGG